MIKGHKGYIMACICQGCGKDYKVDLIISDDDWEKIKPEGKAMGAGLLCPRCIGEKIEAFDKYDCFYVVR